MKIKIFLAFSLLLGFYGCEKTVIAYPGNTQNTDPKAPVGAIDRQIDVDDDGKGKLFENSASGLTIGRLNATDPNPDDEVSYELDGQTIDGNTVDFFQIVSDSGETNLVLKDVNVNFEAIGGSKEVVVTIKTIDDSPDEQVSFFSITIKVLNVNETPYYTNLNQIVRYADDNIEYSFNKVEWTDTDEGQNPTLSHSGPSWLNISSEGQMTGTPGTSDIGNNSFILTISDGEINVQEEINIEVRENLAPVFTNTSSIPLNIIVGDECWDVNDELHTLNWYDPNNGTPNFAGNDVVTFSVIETVDWMNWREDGALFCYRAPGNSDEGTSTVTLKLEDNRENASQTTEFQFDLTVIANDAPTFSNLSSFPSQMDTDVIETLEFTVEWVDPNQDQTTFDLAVEIGSNTYSTSQLSWISIDQSGLVSITPGSSNNGEKTFIFSISDGCYTSTESKIFTIQ